MPGPTAGSGGAALSDAAGATAGLAAATGLLAGSGAAAAGAGDAAAAPAEVTSGNRPTASRIASTGASAPQGMAEGAPDTLAHHVNRSPSAGSTTARA